MQILHNSSEQGNINITIAKGAAGILYAFFIDKVTSCGS